MGWPGSTAGLSKAIGHECMQSKLVCHVTFSGRAGHPETALGKAVVGSSEAGLHQMVR